MTTAEDTTCRTLNWLAAATAIAMFALPLCYRFPLLDPDEGLHASIAQEMLETGNWVAPSFLGKPFLDKPALYFWVQAASLKVFGETEAAVRFPGLLFGFLGALTTALLAAKMFGRKIGVVSGVFYSTTILPTAMTQAASHDVAMIPWINLALLALLESERTKRRRAFCIIAGVFLGLSVLTKGMLGVAVVALAYGGIHIMRAVRRENEAIDETAKNARKNWADSFHRRLLAFGHGLLTRGYLGRMVAAFAVAVLVALPWYVAVEKQYPNFLYYYFIERHLLAFATATQPHSNQPWWYYLPLLLGGGLPWIGYLWRDVRENAEKEDAYRRLSASDRETPQSPAAQQSPIADPQFAFALWFWLIGWTLLLTAARAKLATYLWPAFPPLAILAALTWTHWLDGTLSEAARRRFARTFCSSSWSGPIVLPAALFAIGWVCGVQFAWPTWAAVSAVAIAALFPLWPWKAGRRVDVLSAAVTSVILQFTAAMIFIVPTAAGNYTARDLARYFNQRQELPPRLFIVEERIGSLVFYLDPPLRVGLTESRIAGFSADELPAFRPGDVVAVPLRKWSQVCEPLRLNGRDYTPVGRYRLYRME